MGLFDGISLKGIVEDVTQVVGAFTGAGAPQGDYTIYTTQSGENSKGSPKEQTDSALFAEALKFGLNVGQQSAQKLAQENKGSSVMENGPQVYTGSMGSLVTQGVQTIAKGIFGGGAGSAIVGGLGGAMVQYGIGQMMNGDSCGCGPKPFVRLDKCGRPIITRAMQAKAKAMVMCMGIEGAAAALGVDVPLLAEIAFKRFKPRAKGISGAQLKTAQRVNNKVMSMAKKLEASCKRPVMRRR